MRASILAAIAGIGLLIAIFSLRDFSGVGGARVGYRDNESSGSGTLVSLLPNGSGSDAQRNPDGISNPKDVDWFAVSQAPNWRPIDIRSFRLSSESAATLMLSDSERSEVNLILKKLELQNSKISSESAVIYQPNRNEYRFFLPADTDPWVGVEDAFWRQIESVIGEKKAQFIRSRSRIALEIRTGLFGKFPRSGRIRFNPPEYGVPYTIELATGHLIEQMTPLGEIPFDGDVNLQDLKSQIQGGTPHTIGEGFADPPDFLSSIFENENHR